mmetsp:Transcript_2113/g.6364  ORF Transcript_2113/g.6364 Transcript_2113/m.6364 type:complete len:263 (+) Transcript_2113:1002-1790(+)
MDRDLLCHTVGLATNGACTMGAMALPVRGAIRVSCLALHGCFREHLERRDGAPTKVLVRCENTCVRHIRVDSSAHVGRREVRVQALAVVDAIKTPGGRVSLAQLPIQLQQLCTGPLRLPSLLCIKLGDCSPRRVCLQSRGTRPRMGVNLLLDGLPCCVHDEDAEAAVVGPSTESCRCAWRHVLRQPLEVPFGASFRAGNDPPELLALIHYHSIIVDDDRRAVVGHGPGAMDLHDVLKNLSAIGVDKLRLRPLADRACLQHGG